MQVCLYIEAEKWLVHLPINYNLLAITSTYMFTHLDFVIA